MQSKKVYIASDGFLAFIDRVHPKYMHASAFFRYFAKEHYQVYTSIVTINDTYAALSQTISPSLGRDFLRALSLSSVNILYPEPSDVKTAMKIVLNTNSANLAFAKALMAIICSKHSIPHICTFDYLHAMYGLQPFFLPI